MIAGCTTSMLGYWNQFNEMSEALDKKDATIGERDQKISRLEEDLSRLEEDLARAIEEKKKSDKELQASQLEYDRLRGQALDLEACGYDRFRGHLRKAVPHFDPVTNWSYEFSDLLDWVVGWLPRS